MLALTVPELPGGAQNGQTVDIVLSNVQSSLQFTLPDAFTYIVTDQVLLFGDPALESAIREAIGKPQGDILNTDLVQAGLTTLDASGRYISDLTGLENCGVLTHLHLSNNRITDLGPLAGLTNLIVLDVSENYVTDLTPLAGLTNLTTLDLHGNQITDLSALSDLAQLTLLYLHYNTISDIGALSGLTKLVTLSLSANRIVDISPLSGLTSLNGLYLGMNQIVDISTLSNLTNLIQLAIDRNRIVDITALSRLTRLTFLYMDMNHVSDIGPLASLVNLYQLVLDGNYISDIAPLVANIGLSAGDSVSIEWNPLSPLAVAQSIPTLVERGVILEFTPPPDLDWVPPFIDSDTVLVTGTIFAGAFVAVGGGLYPVFQMLPLDETAFAIEVPLKQNAVNNLSILAVDVFGRVTTPALVRVVERGIFEADAQTVTRLYVAAPLTEVAVGDWIQFHCTAEFTDGSTADVTQFVDWAVSNGEIITKHGLYINVLEGDARVTAALDDVVSVPVLVSDVAAKEAGTVRGLGACWVTGVVQDEYTELGLGPDNPTAGVAACETGHSEIVGQVQTLNELGNYFMTLDEGIYDLTGNATGYGSLTFPQVELAADLFPVKDFALPPNDSDPPEISIIDPVPDSVFEHTEIPITAKVYDKYSDIASAVLVVNGTEHVNITGSIIEQGFYRATVDMPEGSVTIHIEAEDTLGNSITSDQVSFVVEVPVPGDVNGDRLVTAVDVQLVINAVLNLGVPYDCDINSDEATDATDVQLVINAALGIPIDGT